MRNVTTWFILAGIMLLLDLYVFQAVKLLSAQLHIKTKNIIATVYWSISVLTIISLIAFPYLVALQNSKFFRNYLFAILVGLFFAKLLGSIFFLVDDLRRLIIWLMGKIFPSTGARFMQADGMISRSAFLSWIGLGVGGSLFATLLYGFSNKYNYQIKRVRLKFKNLPAAFEGLKLVHISDIHSGSFQDKNKVLHGVDLILKEQPDVIFFTGDLVNDRCDEMNDYIDVFNKLKAPLGVYSTLGNHDYGDYVSWPSADAKKQNLERLKQIHAQMGWRLLMNEHVILQKEGQAIAVLGIENWSAKGRFPKYGKLDDAFKGSEHIPFKILLSHDPSHWEAEVIPNYPSIDLMLSGHTHGMQFGLENPYFKWSPVQWVYKQWAGLYENQNQKLYVNRGFGFIGYPGRVGILPEITVIELTA